jgi:lysine 2,3-aminomutase
MNAAAPASAPKPGKRLRAVKAPPAPAPLFGHRAGFDPSRHGKAFSPWKDVPDADWQSPQWQLRNLVRTPEQLQQLLGLPDEEVAALRRLGLVTKFAVSPYYFSLIDVADAGDPIRRIIVPSAEEESQEGLFDPLGEKDDQVAPGLTHRYPDRVLLVVTSFCSSYCRFCIRKRNWKHSDAARSREEVDAALAYLRTHDEVRDVLVSGGDPLTLPHEQLEYVLAGLKRIPHIEFVRIGSREPVMLPMRIDDALCRLLDRHGPVWVNTHFNHAREITPEAAAGCERMARAGVPVGNQSVLLAGVNDDLQSMKELCQGLLRIRVRPYYLYHCDPVMGAAHLRASVWRGMEIMEGLRGHTTGLAVPTYVVDAPGGGGKIPLMPNYLVSAAPGRVVLRNYEGMLISYPDGGTPAPDVHGQASSVHDLAVGNGLTLSAATGSQRAKRRLATRARGGPTGGPQS